MLLRGVLIGCVLAAPAFACKREPPASSRVRAPGVVVDTCCEGFRCAVTVTPEGGAAWTFVTNDPPSTVLPWPAGKAVVDGARLVTPSATLRPEDALTAEQRAQVPPRCSTCGCKSRFEVAGMTATGVVMEALPDGATTPLRVHLDAVSGTVKPWAPRQEACAEVLASRSFGTPEERLVRLSEVLFALEDAPSRECVEALASVGVEPPRVVAARGFERLALQARVRLVLAAARYPSLAWVAWRHAPREAVSPASSSTRAELQAWVFFLRPRFVGAVVVLVVALLVAWRTRRSARRGALAVVLVALGVAALEGPDALAFARRDQPSLGFVPGELFERSSLGACVLPP